MPIDDRDTARQIDATRAGGPGDQRALITQGSAANGDLGRDQLLRPSRSLEDIVLGAIPGLPKVNLFHPVLAYEQGGEDFLAAFRSAIRGDLGRI